MADEVPDPVAEDAPAEPRRVRRRRSTRSRGRPKGVQSRVPFTSLRFMRPRLPTPVQAIGLAIALLALGLSVWTLRITDRAGLTLTQTRTLLAVDTRGATAGRLAADQLAASAQAEAAQMMAAQDLARRQATREASTGGYAPPVYVGGAPVYAGSPQEGYAGGTTSMSPPIGGTAYGSPYGQTPYGASPYGRSTYGGSPQSAPAASDGNAMGYTLPQATTH